MTETNVQEAIAFLDWLFGSKPDGKLYVLRQRTHSDPAKARQGEMEVRGVAYSAPEKLDTTWWREESPKWGQTFCTSPIANPEENNHIENCINVPALWVDIDECKRLGIPGDEFWTDLKATEDVSAWVRSSENGIQAFFKLTEPFEFRGDKESFKDEIEPLLWDICYYYGGDPKVVNAGRLMRLPGSLNVKREYSRSFLAYSRIYEDNLYNQGDLHKRFKPDINRVPKLVSYAISRALTNRWNEGERHDLSLRLCGTVRRCGIDKPACASLLKEVCAAFGDKDDRSANVDSTYERDLSEIAGLKSEYPDLAETIEPIIEWWVKIKKIYAKKRGFEFIPENVDPTQAPVDNGVFFERGFETWCHGRDADQCFANFVLRLKGKIIKSDSLASVWRADVLKEGENVPTEIEIPAEKHHSFKSFSTIANLPSGCSCLIPALWPQYVAYLDSICPNHTLVESSYYGILDAKTEKPTLLFPGIEHERYIWTGTEDTATIGIWGKCPSRSDAKKYLQQFVDCWEDLHEPSYIWTALGWFSACSISSYLKDLCSGFPTLVITGLSGSGKSLVGDKILRPHFGAGANHSFPTTTTYAMRQFLMSNNICPLVMDEFRDDNERKTAETQSTIRSLYDNAQSSAGLKSGGVRKQVFCTPLCLIGEHHYTDEASVQRSITIRVDRKYVTRFISLPESEQREITQRHAWLQRSEHTGRMSNIILDWVSRHFEDIPDLVAKAKQLVQDSCPPSIITRKVDSFACVLAGLMLFKKVCREYEVELELTRDQMLEYIYKADRRIQGTGAYDFETLQTLFEVTDQVIIDGFRRNISLKGNTFIPDPDDDQFVYFDMTRWYGYIRPLIRASSSATLTDKNAFRDLILEHSRQPDTPFVDFPDHPVFHQSCVKIDLDRVAQKFKINARQWLGLDRHDDDNAW